MDTIIEKVKDIEKTKVENTIFTDPNQVEDQIEEHTNIADKSLNSSLLVEEIKDIK